jgi:hypothetical protein
LINDRLPFGVVEMKAAWVDDRSGMGSARRNSGRVALPTMALLNVRFLVAAAAEHVLEPWKATGGVVVADIPPAPYR